MCELKLIVEQDDLLDAPPKMFKDAKTNLAIESKNQKTCNAGKCKLCFFSSLA